MPFVSQTIDDYDERFSNLRNHILYSLGWPMVRVELTDESLSVAIIDAITRFYDRAAMDVACEYASVEAGNVVTIPSTIKGSMIENVIFPMETIDSYSKNILSLRDVVGYEVIPLSDWSSMLDRFDMVGYYLYLKRIEDFKKIVGITHHWDIVNGQIYLYPGDATIEEIGIVYKAEASDEGYEGTNWVKDWATAKAKHMLGTARSKMSGFTTAGGNISADGETMRSEGKEEMAALAESLNLLQKPMPFLQG